jgi:hypothetical protein
MTGTAGSLPKNLGDTIYGADYNAVRTKINGVLGDGAGYSSTYGYGQPLASSAVAADQKIDNTEWNNLFSDIDKAYTHQNGVAYSDTNPTAGLTISRLHLNAFNTSCDTLLTNRLAVAAGQQTSAALSSPSRSTAWGGGNSSITASVNLNLGGSLRNAQYFFNQGGFVTIQGTMSGGTSGTASTQDYNWAQLMAAFSSSITYGVYDSIVAGGGGLVNLINTSAPASPYELNDAILNASTTDGFNITLAFTFIDGHVGNSGGFDTVGGTIGANITSYYATGAFTGIQPSSTVTSNF